MLDGTDVDEFRKSLIDANHQHTKVYKKKIPRFGRKAGKIPIGSSSQRSNMLEPMSDAVSMKAGKLDEASVHESFVDGSQWRPEEKDDINSNDSGSAMMEFRDNDRMEDQNME